MDLYGQSPAKFLWLPNSMKNGLIANNSVMKLSTHTGIHVNAHDLAFRISPSKVRPCYFLGVPHIATSDLVHDELVASTINTPFPVVLTQSLAPP
ncbi:hypothetical protein C1H46_016397 [Malus baccata]|uniref:Uncharacterized protein n=1 Tax=Malus baccata TaxID=106549 RepID=A0A540MH31_MALBA|nr:hypothetical protein C1H46_016397 [Malus baccata]